MTTWAEVQAHVRTRYELDTDTDDGFSLSFGYADGHRQLVQVRRFQAFEIDWLEFRSAVGPASWLDPEQALRQNEAMACGSLAIDAQDTLVLLYSAPLPTMDTEELELPLFVIAGHARRLASELADPDP